MPFHGHIQVIVTLNPQSIKVNVQWYVQVYYSKIMTFKKSVVRI